jgi:hypothetical protein
MSCPEFGAPNHRPGLAYILEGQMTERRGPGFAPLVPGPGGVALKSTALSRLVTPAPALAR